MRIAKGLINYLNYPAKGNDNCWLQDSQSFVPVSQLPAALRLPQKKTKNTTLCFRSMYLVNVVTFIDFRDPKPFAAVSQRSAALRLPEKKTHPWRFGKQGNA